MNKTVIKLMRWIGIGAVLLVAAFGIALVYEFSTEPTLVNAEVEFENELYIPPLVEPTEINGKKVFDLTLQQGETEILDGKMTQTWGANGTHLMPTIRAQDGEDIEIRVTNELNEMTTLHWHGMHLPAIMDGVHQIITPDETWQPYWQVRQEAATLWYHPHLEGLTGEHVYNGLAGLFIIDDENSQSLNIPQEYGVNDIPVIVQDRKFNQDGQFVYEPNRTDAYGHKGMLGDTLLVNGTYSPYLEVPAGLVRLRILNGSNARRYNFGFDDDREFYQIASDGGFLEQPISRTRVLLAPGERAEILVDVSDLNDVRLMSYAVDEWSEFETLFNRITGVIRDEDQHFKVLEIRPQDAPAEYTTIPTQLNTIERLEESDAVITREFELEDDNTINGKKMRMDRIDFVVQLGTTEIWEITNDSPSYHPFHVHDVQFQILDRDGNKPAPYEMGWKDTVIVNPEETVRIIVRFEDYADPHVPYMFHCHILEHEDHGMMGQFVVVADDSVQSEVRTEALGIGLTHTH